jgi:hypothetical protein
MVYTEFEVFWKDLTKEAQARLKGEGFEDDENMEFAPLFILGQGE